MIFDYRASSREWSTMFISLNFFKTKSGNQQQNNRNALNNEAGFSLIELLFVIMILAILIPIATLTYSGYQVRATTDLVNIDLRVIGAAARTYYLNHQAFPASIQKLVDDGYLTELPKDKFVPGGTAGYYCTPSSNPFKVWSVGPNKKPEGGAADDIKLEFAP